MRSKASRRVSCSGSGSRQDKAAITGLFTVCLLILLAIFAPLIARAVGHGPNELFQTQMLDDFGLPKGPNADFFFGADQSGRDVFVRVLYGARTSLLVAIVATGVAVVIGTVLGLISGYFRGFTDTVISRCIDVILALPLLLFAIGIVAACGTSKEGCIGGLVQPGLGLVIFIIAIFSWPYIARIVRGNVLSIREKEYVEAARSLGAGNIRIMFKEVLPNLIAPIIVYSTLLIPSQHPLRGSVVVPRGGRSGQARRPGDRCSPTPRAIFDVAWWLMLFPGLFLIATTLSFNLLGDGLRDAFDPRTDR